MSGLLWFLVWFFFTSAIITVTQVGKPRKPTTPGVAAGVVVIDALIIAAIFYFGWGMQ